MKPMKRVMMILMAFTLFFAVAAPDFADARRGGGGFKSGTRSYSTTPKKSTTTNNIKKVTALKAPQQDLPLIRNVDSSAAAA